MKIPKTFVFMVFNPIAFAVSLFVSWVSFSALITLADDPFIYGTWPGVVAAASIRTALSLIIGDIVADFAYEVYWIAIPCALLISFRRARGHLKGITKERQVWIQWYHQQQEAITQGNIFEEIPPFREAQSVLLRLIQQLMAFIVHFSCWFSAFALLATILQPSNGIVEAAHYLVRAFPDIAIPAIIHALLSSYQEARGTIKEVAKEQQVWMKWCDMRLKWHQRQQGAKALGYTLTEAPPSPPVNAC